jgi:hypothetical protein
VDDDRVGADLHPIAHLDRAQQLGAGTDHDVAADRRVALAAEETRTPERDALVERDLIAELGGLADHHAGAMVDEERAADLRRGMDLHAGRDPGEVRERAREQRHARLVHRVRDAMREQRLDAAVREQDLPPAHVARRGVAFLRGG